ncbi:MAG: hypothetical protein NZO58_12760, partial [Gemmataceae bacterium]|nr:hypothetical protein [Gemmataceae bacterium]
MKKYPMTISATCPKGHTLTLEERLAGKKIRCPRCQVVFQVPELDDDEDDDEAPAKGKAAARKNDAPGRRKVRQPVDEDDDDEDEDDERPSRRPVRRPADEEDEDDEDEEQLDPEEERKLARRAKKKALKLVNIGMLMHNIKLYLNSVGLLFFVGLIGILLFAYARGSELQDENPKKTVVVSALQMDVLRDRNMALGADAIVVQAAGGETLGSYAIDVLVLFATMLFMGLLAPLTGLVGSILACWIPKKSEARGSLIVSLCFDAVALLTFILWALAAADVFGMESMKTFRLMQLLWLITALSMILSWLMFLTFERNLGKYIGDARLGNEALNRIVGLALQVLILGIALVVNGVGAKLLGGVIGMILGFAALGGWLLYYLLFFLRKMITLFAAMRAALATKL